MKSRIVLLGAPGSGKGTQAEMITRHFAIPVTSTGTILRRERDLGTPLGVQADETAKQGGLVSDDVIVKLIEDWLNLHGENGFVFDGFPRTVPQAERLDEILKKRSKSVDLAIWLEVSEKTIQDRIACRLQCRRCGFTTSVTSACFSERPVCPYCDGPLIRRDDDDAAVLQTRLAEFRSKTEPLLSYYEKAATLHRVDGNRDRETVFSDLAALIEEKRQ
jgi:adenylate kinase